MSKRDKAVAIEDKFQREYANQIIEQIKQGTAAWQQPWKPGERSLPRNLSSGKDYSGSNTLRLMTAAQARGYSDSRWGTYKQIREEEGQVRRAGESKAPASDSSGRPVT